jgi:hypothetical protein
LVGKRSANPNVVTAEALNERNLSLLSLLLQSPRADINDASADLLRAAIRAGFEEGVQVSNDLLFCYILQRLKSSPGFDCFVKLIFEIAYRLLIHGFFASVQKRFVC